MQNTIIIIKNYFWDIIILTGFNTIKFTKITLLKTVNRNQ